MPTSRRAVRLATTALLATIGFGCGSSNDEDAACNKLDLLDHPNAIVRFRQGTFTLGTTEEIDHIAKPLRTLDFRIAESAFAPDPQGPKGHLAAYVRFFKGATSTNLNDFLANARRQEAVIEAKAGDCPLKGK